jgi:hypothetical protein
MVSSKPVNTRAWAGWVIFASSMLVIIGTFNIIEGLVALFDDKRLGVQNAQLVVVDITGWAWLLLLFGIVMVLAGFGLLATQSWARIAAVVIVGLHAVLQMFALAAYPVWSLLMIALDTFVIYALTARWSDATTAMDPFGAMGGSPGQHADVPR